MMVIKNICALLIVASFIFSGEAFAKRTRAPELEAMQIAKRAQIQKRTQQRRQAFLNKRKASAAPFNKRKIGKHQLRRENPQLVSKRTRFQKIQSTPLISPQTSQRARGVNRSKPQPIQTSNSRTTHTQNIGPQVYTLLPTDFPQEFRASAIQLAREEGLPETPQGGFVVTQYQLKSALNMLAIKEKKYPTLVSPGTTQRFRQFLATRYGYQG